MASEDPIKIDPEIMHGTPCFNGTRVPVDILFDYIKAGDTIDFFLEQYPTVKREQVMRVVEQANEAMTRRPGSKVA